MLRTPTGEFVLDANRWDELAGRQPAEPAMVSVIVPYYQAQTRLDRLLAALSLQTHPADRFEVIVADDGSPRPPDLGAARGIEVRTVWQPDQGFRAAAARNLAAADARGAVLCFLDDDIIPEPGYLAAISRLPALAPDTLVTGRRRHADLTGWGPDRVTSWLTVGEPPTELTEPAWLLDEHRRSANLLRLQDDSYRFVISAVLACSRSLFVELGGFDETLVGYGGEDWELAHRALCAGAVLAHEPAAVGWHDGPDWAERGDAQSRRAEKNAETLALASRIPRFGNANGEWRGCPDVVVRLAVGDEEPAAVVIAVGHLLAAGPDLGIWLTGPRADRLKDDHFGQDSRISTGPVRTATARITVELSRPLIVAPDFWPPLIRRLTESGHRSDEVGELIVHTDDGRLRATASRATHRAHRWQDRFGADRDLIEELFGRAVLDRPDGVRPVPRNPALAYELARIPSVRRS